MSTEKPLFFATHHLRPAAVELLDAHVEIAYALPDDERTRLAEPDPEGARTAMIAAAVSKRLPTAHALHTVGRVTREMLESATRLEVVVVPSSGYDNVDVAAATELGLPVVHAAGSAYEPVAEHVLGLMLSLAKWIAVTDRNAHASGHSTSNRAMLLGEAPAPTTLWGKTIGIIGYGFIGRSLAQKCRDAFGMRVLAYDPFFDAVEAERLGVQLVDLPELLTASDYVSVNAPLIPQTAGLIGTQQLALMKSSAYLINTARGGLVDTPALVDALQSGAIAGAGLDVTDPEPLPDGHPLFSMDNVVLTPHLAGISAEFLARNAAGTARDALDVLAGRRPTRLVNPEVWDAYLARRHRLQR